jgi:hypothetical protein
MSIHQRPHPRQDRRRIGRAPIKKHSCATVGTHKASAASFNLPYKTTADESAALDAARAKNRAGRKPA